MDKDVLFRALMAAVLAVLLWNLLIKATTPPQPAGAPGAPGAAPVVAEATVVPQMPAGVTLRGADEEQVIALGNIGDASDGPHPLRVQLSNRGAALVSTHLRDFNATLGGDQRYTLVRGVEVGDRTYNSLATRSVTVQGMEIPLGQAYWQLDREKTNERQAVFQIDVFSDDQPLVRVFKTYILNEAEPEAKHGDVTLDFSFQNLSATDLDVIVTQWGPVGISQEDPRQDQRRVTAGLAEGSEVIAEFLPHRKLSGSLDELVKSDAQTLEWVAVGNKFFAVIVAPRKGDGPLWIADARATNIGGEDLETDGDTFRLVTTKLSVAAGGQLSRQLDCYFGPKSKQIFTSDPAYAQRQYVALVSADYYFCAWTWVVNMMLWLLDTVHGIWPYNYGIAIIVMVLIVRTLLHPLTKQGQVSMARMAERVGKLQPKMEELKEKYKNDRQKLNQETMKLYQQEGINPAAQMLTCLPMMFQLPIWAGLWASLMYTVELRHAPFCLWIQDLTAPDHFMPFGTDLPFVGEYFNLLPPLLGLSMYLQNRLMPKPAAAASKNSKTPDQMAQQRMMMTIMSVMMIVFFYNAPSGLTLYIMASNFFGLLEQYLVRKHIREEKERAKLRGPQEPKASSFRKPRFLEKLERMAEEAKKSQ